MSGHSLFSPDVPRIRRTIAAALLLIILCIAANAAAFLIDTPRMRQNAAQGIELLRQEGSRPEMIGGFQSSQPDNYTVILKLKTAAYVGPESILQKALGGLRVDLYPGEGGDAWDAYATYADSGDIGGFNYSRYWHGYTLPLRLLLCVLNFSNIQLLLYFLQLGLLVAVLMQMKESGLSHLIPAFFCAYFLMMPAQLGLCLQYAPCSLIMLLSCLMMLRWRRLIDSTLGVCGTFLIIGILTNYFDLLTFPLVTLGFPLILLTAMELDEPLMQLIIRISLRSACWGIGFAGMWVVKWCLAAAVFGSYVFANVFAQTTQRLSGAESGQTGNHRFSSLFSAVNILYAKTGYRIVILSSCASSLISGFLPLRGRHRIRTSAIVFLLIACFAPALCIVMANHWADHGYFTYRNLAVSFFAVYALLACLVKKSKA